MSCSLACSFFRWWSKMRNILLAPLWLLAAVAAIVIIPVIILGMLVLGLIVWACGVPITIKHKGTKDNGAPERTIGYVRWFKFHRYDHNGLAGPFKITRR